MDERRWRRGGTGRGVGVSRREQEERDRRIEERRAVMMEKRQKGIEGLRSGGQ